jgi:ribosomal protein S18 acetylase RimI-like enzyme
MQIITYHELKDKTDLFLLWAKSFGWLCTPKQMDHWVKTDERLIGTPVGVCAIIDSKLAGFVGIMEIPTRDKRGETEMVGGIWGVATRPMYARQGVGGHLLEAAENHFRSKGIRLSLLTTSRTLISYRGYVSFGYREVEKVNGYAHYYKIPRRSAKADLFPPGPKGKAPKLDLKQIRSNFNRYARNHCGFTNRLTGALKEQQEMGYFDPKYSTVQEEGHLLSSSQTGSLWISEIIAFNQRTARELIQLAVKSSGAGIYVRYVFDPLVAATLEKMSFRKDPGSYGVLMAKPLAGVSFDDVYDDTFLWSSADFF